ncbi:hypothetical protein CAPTEDRAFT_209894 [Capitella teleta]|uniref:TNFR-Cys domain-containing protein n=1 Tax=Capitella teleta TaxID=283909 RepID=R7UNW9_CAPTE|nr:hypothetical protein CAPTEDRAFT_209894 [Capitella teleta]|eukprot:ELU07920.1 hypothetical protein CAPTEDRAFT_209894 [Capitella teleta]
MVFLVLSIPGLPTANAQCFCEEPGKIEYCDDIVEICNPCNFICEDADKWETVEECRSFCPEWRKTEEFDSLVANSQEMSTFGTHLMNKTVAKVTDSTEIQEPTEDKSLLVIAPIIVMSSICVLGAGITLIFSYYSEYSHQKPHKEPRDSHYVLKTV